MKLRYLLSLAFFPLLLTGCGGGDSTSVEYEIKESNLQIPPEFTSASKVSKTELEGNWLSEHNTTIHLAGDDEDLASCNVLLTFVGEAMTKNQKCFLIDDPSQVYSNETKYSIFKVVGQLNQDEIELNVTNLKIIGQTLNLETKKMRPLSDNSDQTVSLGQHGEKFKVVSDIEFKGVFSIPTSNTLQLNINEPYEFNINYPSIAQGHQQYARH